MSWRRAVLLAALVSGACGDQAAAGTDASANDAASPDDSSADAASDAGPAPADGGAGDIGAWTDAPGACPGGMPKVDVTTAAELAAATRAEAPYVSDAPATCYFLHDGDYAQSSGVLLYILKGGIGGGTHRVFVGQSRAGVVIHGRASVADGVGDVTLSNLTFDLTGYVNAGSFNTLSLGTGKNIKVDHVTFTGDCATGLKGGHIETNGTSGLLVEACILEKFGHCASGGHEDHGVYLASGTDLTFRNNVIRQNASRGIQMYTGGGAYGTLDTVLIERNRIYANGHGDYEDGILVSASGTGTIANVTVRRNLIYRNFYAGTRFVGGMESAIVYDRNTFEGNGAGSVSASRSEVNLDVAGAGAGTSFAKNLFGVGNLLINDCYDGASLGFGLTDNVVNGPVPGGAKGNCVTNVTAADPQFVDAAGADYHTGNPAVAGYGAYAP